MTYFSINRALTMWCDHLGTKAVTFLIDPLVGPTLGLAARIANL